MDVPFVGQSYLQRSSNINAQRTVNWYLELSPDGKRTVALLPRPGLTSFVVVGTGPIRGGAEFNGVGYIVSGDEFYTLTSAGTATVRGTLNTSTGRVWLAFNGTQVMVTDGTDGYIYTLAAATFAEITDADFPGGGPLTYIDGYFIVAWEGSMYQSGINDGTSWAGLDFATPESSPDGLVTVFADHNELIPFGEKTTEFWSNDAGTDFTFAPYIGAELEIGIAGEFAVTQTDEGLFFLGDDGVFYRLLGHQIQRVSTHAIEMALQGYSILSDCYAFKIDYDGHKFVIFTFPTGNATWVYDVANGGWVEFSTWELGRWDISAAFVLGRTTYVCSATTGDVYEFDSSSFTDDGEIIERVRVTQVANDDQKPIFWRRLEVLMETGVGTSGQAENPQLMLSFSDDGGHTFSSELFGSLGMMGNYGWRVIWQRLGYSRSRIWKLRLTDPANAVLIGARADVELGAY